MKNVLTVIGTRPEAIKMAKLVELLNEDDRFCHKLCATGQHKELLTQSLELFNIVPDYNLQVMTPNQTLGTVTSKILTLFTDVLQQVKPDIVLVHGDTTTSLACALAAYYQQIPVGHVEAGLRTRNKYSPFPEEMNRVLVDQISTYHFAPTQLNCSNLIIEGIPTHNIFVTGNTVIDTLLSVANKVTECPPELKDLKDVVDGKFVLVTGHRRENFGKGFDGICRALLTIAKRYPSHHIIYPVHPNPNVRDVVRKQIGEANNIHLIEPLPYLPFVYLMKKCVLILTDSGGIQEEAPSLNKPVLVMREFTERTEALEEKTIQLVGTHPDAIIKAVSEILDYPSDIIVKANPYGDGHACERIIDHLHSRL